MAILIFEGGDRAGKTSLRELVRKVRNHEDVTLDRYFGSMIVYGRMFHNYTEEQVKDWYIKEALMDKVFNPILIYVKCSIDKLQERIRNTGHEVITEDILKRTIEEYDRYFKESPYKYKLMIDTSNLSTEEVCDKLIDYLTKIERKL